MLRPSQIRSPTNVVERQKPRSVRCKQVPLLHGPQRKVPYPQLPPSFRTPGVGVGGRDVVLGDWNGIVAQGPDLGTLVGKLENIGNRAGISRWEHEAVLEAAQARLVNNPDAMRFFGQSRRKRWPASTSENHRGLFTRPGPGRAVGGSTPERPLWWMARAAPGCTRQSRGRRGGPLVVTRRGSGASHRSIRDGLGSKGGTPDRHQPAESERRYVGLRGWACGVVALTADGTYKWVAGPLARQRTANHV